jgi:phosphoserine phosphatase
LIDYFVADNTSDKIIVSAGYSIYIKHFITLLPFRVNNIYASNLLFTKGKFNGEIDRSVYSNDKVKILYEFNIIKNECPISCFTDSISDLPLINLSTKIFCVNPDKQLRALAIEKNWKII